MTDQPSPQEISRTHSRLRSAIIAIVWGAGLELAVNSHRLGLYILIGLTLVFCFTALWWLRRQALTSAGAITIIMLMITGPAVISFISGIALQHLVVISLVLLSWLAWNERNYHDHPLAGRLPAFINSITLLCVWVTLLSTTIYLNVSWWWMTIVAGVATVGVTMAIWLTSGLGWRTVRWGYLVFAWLGMELFALSWALPIAIFVRSVLATTILSLTIQASRHLWLEQWEAGRGRRYLIIGSTICLIVLITARWV